MSGGPDDLPVAHDAGHAPAGLPVGRLCALLGGPAAGALVHGLLTAWSPEVEGLQTPELAWRVAGVMAWMAVWWLTEAIPLAATSLIPLFAWPALGVLGSTDAAAPYANRVIFLYLGGFMLAAAMERWNLHRRFALLTVLLLGTRPAMVVAGFMLATGILSMWLSNTATAVMMLPIAASVVGLLESRLDAVDASRRHDAGANFAVCIYLGIAYAASIGGIATPIGTPPNGTLLGFFEKNYGVEIGFGQWMLVGVPIVLVFGPVCWLVLTRLLYPVRAPHLAGGRALILSELRALGPMGRGERTVLVVFAVTVLLWTLRDPAAGGLLALAGDVTGGFVGGLATFARYLAGLLRRLDDAGVAIAAAVVLFAVPVNLRRRTFALDWASASRIPWGILLLFGGGLSLAEGVSGSGLDGAIAASVSTLGGLPGVVIVLAAVAIVVFLTEMTSNTATAAIAITLFAGVASGLGMDPVMMTVPAALAASCAFMLPVATPPNAIVYGTGRVRIGQMARAGLVLNLVSIALVTAAAYTVVTWVLGGLVPTGPA